MTPNDEPVEPVKPVPPAEDIAEPDEPLEPPGWTITAEDIAAVEGSGITLADVIRELGLEDPE